MGSAIMKKILDEISKSESLSEKISILKEFANGLEEEIKDNSLYKLPFAAAIVAEALLTIREELSRLHSGPALDLEGEISNITFRLSELLK